MGEYIIPSLINEIKKPKISGTNIPNLLGSAVIVYGNGMRKHIDLYYIQKLIKGIIKVILFPFKQLICLYYKKKYQTAQTMMNFDRKCKVKWDE